MPSLTTKVAATIAANRMLTPGAPLVVAVSGGPDSLCLLHVLVALRDQLGVDLHVAHLDHMIRGAESAAEAAFVAETARSWGLPATVAAADVPAIARQDRANLHAAARQARYAFLAQVARDTGAQAVAVAHHAGDQAETVLLHLLRGAGPEGLRGMRPVVAWEEWAEGEGRERHGDTETRRHGDEARQADSPSPLLPVSPALIRPLLAVTRAEIEAYCAQHDLRPRHDPSNMDLDATRNRIRHDLLPRLIEYNPRIVDALGRTATISADEHAFIADALDAAWPRVAREREGAIAFDGAAWREQHPAVQRAAIRRAHRRLAPGEPLGMDHVEQARAASAQGVGWRLELPGGVALTVGYGGDFTLGTLAYDGPQLPFAAAKLPAEGRLDLGEGWAIEVGATGAHSLAGDRWAIELDAAAIGGPLLVRRRRPGDRIRLAGAGSKRLQDLFVDAKLPRELRAAWPVVATHERVIWVAGLRADTECLATAGSDNRIKVGIIYDPVMQNEK